MNTRRKHTLRQIAIFCENYHGANPLEQGPPTRLKAKARGDFVQVAWYFFPSMTTGEMGGILGTSPGRSKDYSARPKLYYNYIVEDTDKWLRTYDIIRNEWREVDAKARKSKLWFKACELANIENLREEIWQKEDYRQREREHNQKALDTVKMLGPMDGALKKFLAANCGKKASADNTNI